MKLRAGDEVVSVDVARNDASILMITEAGYGKRTRVDSFRAQARGGLGVRGIQIKEKKGYVVSAFMAASDDEIVAVTSGGSTIRTSVNSISSQGRTATGVRVMTVEAGQTVSSVALILAADE